MVKRRCVDLWMPGEGGTPKGRAGMSAVDG